jgi:hypothetical protein
MTNVQLISFILLWIVILIEGVLLVLLYRHVGQIYIRQWSGLPRGSKAPMFSAVDPRGEEVSFEDLLKTSLNLIIFGSFGCSSCHDLLRSDELLRYLATHSIAGYFLTSTSDGKNGSSQLEMYHSQVDGRLIVLTTSADTFSSFRVRGTPFMYILNRQGMVLAGGAVSEGPVQVVKLLGQLSRA